jgi:8-oxo-dGTP pyrophosphatase MutT (NUDIX family)
MIPQMRDRLGTYRARDIHCVRSKWAGVAVLIFEDRNELFIILTKRTDFVRHHKGEVSFPGGMFEEKDNDRRNTAIRECCEEVGVRPADIDIIGRLDDMYTMTGFCIRPYIGMVPFPYSFTINPREVAYLIYLPFKFLESLKPGMEEVERGGNIQRVPSFFFEGDRIWGATCRILLMLRRIIKNGSV